MSERTVASALPARPLVAVAAADTILHAAVLMAQNNCGSALVLSAETIVGIVTERDILIKVVAKAVDPATTSVDAVMTKRPVCAHHDMPVTHALYTMRELGFRHIPVIDADRKPMGVFALRDALPEELAGADNLTQRVVRLTETLG
ncbi:MAG: CBS domain-containing protein [Rhodocyclaceae bacterium]|nr:CBS domain-containing protein [Rhodocyclaceae bacterium]